MACFLVPVAEAIVTTTVEKVLEKKEKSTRKNAENFNKEICEYTKTPFYKKLKWLNMLLLGGAFLLLIEHIWHGEITLSFPFFTAFNSVEDSLLMLKEMATVGVGMSVLVTLVWVGMLIVSNIKEKKARKSNKENA